ncbi:zinc finger BED domain-containing protein 5-like [Macrobrachium rosenbergii]|uniref:zinc finger BED domain-containing protein 5-like n=1 Tax=Macrobrachium rosenbergii TaxID=79674 RepID=UPI0034D641D3
MATDVMNAVSSFFDKHGLSWNNLVGITTDGAPAMLGSRSGFQAKVKPKAPNAVGVHCFIHREALASKSLPSGLLTIFTAELETLRKGFKLAQPLLLNTCILAKLELYKKRVSVGKFMMFLSLNEVLADGQLSSTLSKEIMDHLSQLDDEFRRYFPDLSTQHAGIAKNPFLCLVDDVLEDAQEEFIELIHDSTAKNVFQSNSLSSFWCSMME